MLGDRESLVSDELEERPFVMHEVGGACDDCGQLGAPGLLCVFHAVAGDMAKAVAGIFDRVGALQAALSDVADELSDVADELMDLASRVEELKGILPAREKRTEGNG